MRWEWVAGHAHPERRFDEAAIRDARSAADLIGYLNYIHPYRVQIVGRHEVAYLSQAAPEVIDSRIARIVTLEPPLIIVADGQVPPDRLVAMCDRAEIPLFVTAESAGHVIDVLRAYLGQRFAERTTRHGVFMDILGLGVLLTGESGLGKSELGLELISRGHGLGDGQHRTGAHNEVGEVGRQSIDRRNRGRRAERDLHTRETSPHQCFRQGCGSVGIIDDRNRYDAQRSELVEDGHRAAPGLMGSTGSRPASGSAST